MLAGEGRRHETSQCAAKQKVEHKVLHDDSEQSGKAAGQSSMRRRSLLTAGATTVQSDQLFHSFHLQLIRLREKTYHVTVTDNPLWATKINIHPIAKLRLIKPVNKF